MDGLGDLSGAKNLICPVCQNKRFLLKYEASHVYSYVIDTDAPGHKNKDEFLSFQYDNRELMESEQYVECQACGTKFPCSFNIWNNNSSLNELQSVINSGSKQ